MDFMELMMRYVNFEGVFSIFNLYSIFTIQFYLNFIYYQY